MSNSDLVVYTKLSPSNSGKRTHSIDRISPHCVVGQCTAEDLGDLFMKKKASSNYGIDKNGRVGMYVEEKNCSWCTSSDANDQRAVTIECASDTKAPYEMKNAVYTTLIELCTDICRRNGKKKLLWFEDKNKTLAYNPKNDEMIITVHRWFDNKDCPGDWLYKRLGDLAKKVTENLSIRSPLTGTSYCVQTGAYKRKAYADAHLSKVNASGFDAYMVIVDEFYKIHVGAFKTDKEAGIMAKKLKASGFNAIVTKETGIPVSSNITVSSSLAVGDKVKLNPNATIYNKTTKFASFVYSSVLYLRELKGDRAVVSTQKTGAITGAVHKKYLIKI